MSEYDLYAATYDAQFRERLDDVPFYVEEAKRAEPPVLELACGTGRVLIPVAKAGVQVYGLDSSAAMLDVCRRKVAKLAEDLQARITLSEADMRDFSFDERFGLIYCPFRAFLHLMTPEDQITALRRIHDHLRKGGRFTAFGIAPESPCPIDYNNGIVFKGCQIHGINGRKMYDTWYRVRNLLASKRLDPSPVITHKFLLDDYEKGFEKMIERPRQSAKVVLFPDPNEMK